jgi:hypothetical protein
LTPAVLASTLKLVVPNAVDRDSVKTRDHYKGANFDAKKETVRELTKTRTMNISKNDRELMRVLPQTKDGGFNFFAKSRPKAGMLPLIPSLSVQEFGSRSWRKDYLHHYGRRRSNSARNCSHGTAWLRS